MGSRKLGAVIRAARERKAMTITDVARVCGCSPQNLNIMEHGKSYPSVQMFCKLSKLLDIEPSAMVDAVASND